jgi:hypothetical protein
MFVWAMRDKGSEWRAVRKLLERGDLPFTPLVEAVCEPYMPREGEDAENPIRVMGELGGKLALLSTSGRAWVDLGHLLLRFSDHDVAELHAVVRESVGIGSRSVIPVIRTSSPSVIMEAAFVWAHDSGSGICVRVDGVTHLADKAESVRSIVAASGHAPGEIDLIVDAQDLPRAASFEALRDHFPLSQVARNWVVLAGTFPSSITEMKPEDYEHIRERGEWSAWRDEMAHDVGSWRRPQYGDYATQPPVYVPSLPFLGSPSVRYTTTESFVVLRGRAGSPGKPTDFTQFIGHARYLRRQPYYRQTVDTLGDDYADWIASGTNGTGNLTTWRVASLHRHLGVVAQQVVEFAPAAASSR